MTRTKFALILAAAAMALAACSGSSNPTSSGDGGPTDGGSAFPPPGLDGGSGTHFDGGSDAGTSQPSYSGGDVTVTVVSAADAGAPADAGTTADAGVTGDGGSASAFVTGHVIIRLVAATPAAISNIQVFVDGQSLGTLTGTPFDLPWDTSTVANGPHAITATVYDLAGLTAPAKGLDVTTANFQLAGTWNWTGVTDSQPGFPAAPCSDTSFTVGFDAATGEVTFPTIFLSCTAGNGAPYTSTVNGFTTTVTPAQYSAPLSYTAGTVTIQFSTTKLTQSDSFNGSVETGDISR